MITLYHCVSTRSFRPLWMMEELGLSYNLKVLPFPPREKAAGYRQINALGTVPAFFDGEAKMTESAAICHYLVERYGPTAMRVGVDEPYFAAFLNYLHFGEATLTFPQTLVLRYARFESPERRLPQVAEDYTQWFLARLHTLEPLLVESEYLCAERFTAADISVGYALLLADLIGLKQRFRPSVLAYWQRLQEREGFRRALDAQQNAARQQGISELAPV